jgi:hypothetical protein
LPECFRPHIQLGNTGALARNTEELNLHDGVP